MVGELAVDARKVALSKEQCLFVLKRSGELIGVASQVGFFAGEAIVCRLELGIECVKEVVEPLEEPDAVCRYLGRIECAGSCVLQGIAPLRAAQAQTDCAAGRRSHRHLETAIGGDRHGWAGTGCLAGDLQDIEVSLNTLLNFAYFETQDLRDYSQRSQLKGILPIIFVFLARSGKEILNVDYNFLGKGGTRGVKVTFLDPATGAQKALYYFSADLSDDGLKRNSAVLRFCNSLGPTNSLLKAASYLLHQNGFNIARNYLLGVSASILQDDSGIPLRNFTPEKWTLRFFGTYTGPLNLFKSFYQPDLRHYYATSSPKPLTFGFGYQYNRQDATLIFAVRR